jgi:hypothetical protein
VVAVGRTDSLPEVAAVPDQPPDLVQPVALVEFQVSVEEPPLWIDVGEAVSDAVGAGVVARTFTVVVTEALPSPRQYSR